MSTASSYYPAVLIEWRPGIGPGTDSGSWVDITDDVSFGTVRRGRQYETDRFVAGTCRLTLRTTDRTYDPENTSSTYYPNIIPMAQLRIRATWNAVTYAVFQGYITDWGQSVPANKMFETTILAADGFVRLEQHKLPSSAWALEVETDSPSAWFRLGETDTVRMSDSSVGGNYGLYDNCDQGAEGLVINDADGAAAFSHSTEERVYIQNPNLITGYPFTISGMFKIASLPTSFPVFFSGWPNAPVTTTGQLVMGLDTTAGRAVFAASGMPPAPGRMVCALSDGTNTTAVASTIGVDDDLPHHVAWVATSAGVWKVYIDGADVTGTIYSSPGAAAWLPAQPANFTIGNYLDLGVGDFGFGTDVGTGALNSAGQEGSPGIIDELCVWNGTALSAGQVAAHALAAKSGWDGEDTGARVTRFLDAIGWPVTLRDISTGISILGPASWSAGDTALSVLQRWADTELGQFFMSADGKIVWRSRHHPLLNASATTSQATFGDRQSSATLKYDADGLSLPRDQQLIRNPVQASRVGGVTVTVKDQTLIDNKYGDRTWASPPTEDQHDASVRDRAIWILGRYKELGTRLAAMRISPRRDPTNLWPQVLGRVIGDRITIKQKPLGLNNETVTDQIIEGVEHSFDASLRDWKTTFSGSPVDPNVGDYLILNDATYGKLDTGLLAY